MKIGIVGAGVGGLTLALALIKEGYTDIHIYESANKIDELGVGINVLPHAMKIMDELGVMQSLCDASVETDSLNYFTQRGQLILSDKRGKNAGYQWPQISIHRARLINVLHQAVLERLGEERIHLNHRCNGFSTAAGKRASIRFDDRSVDFDLVVGCDGIHSAIRKEMYPDEGDPKWDGITMWRAVSYMQAKDIFESMIIAGKSEHRMVMYPIEKKSDGQYLVNWVAKHKTSQAMEMPRQDWVHKVNKNEIPEYFSNFSFLDIDTLIDKAEAIYKYPQVDRDPLPSWIRNNVTLLGDAAHPMYPSGSNGASQAILDAKSLSSYLKSESSLAMALDRYDHERRRSTTAIVMKNRKAGPERCIDVVENRAPGGYQKIEDVIDRQELESIIKDYKVTAGFDRRSLNGEGRSV